jgi:hypothetical protein
MLRRRVRVQLAGQLSWRRLNSSLAAFINSGSAIRS